MTSAQEKPKPTSWTDSSGAKTVEAEFIKLEGVQLHLRKSDGKQITIPLSKLDDKSRLKARAIAKRATIASSPTGAPGTPSVAIPAPVVFPPNASVQEFMDIVAAEIKKENALVYWDALPPTKQKDVEDLVQLATTKIEQRTLNQIKKFRTEVVKGLRTKKLYILNSKFLTVPPEQRDIIVNSYDPAVNLIEALIPEDMLDISRLQNSYLRDVVGAYFLNLTLKSKAFADTLPSEMRAMANTGSQLPNYTFENVTAKSAMLVLETPQPIPPIPLTLSDGRWLPTSLVDGWDQAIAQLKAGLNAANPKEIHQQIGLAMFTANSALGAFTTAETQEDFDNRIGEVIASLGLNGMVPMTPPGNGETFNENGFSAPNSSSGGFNSGGGNSGGFNSGGAPSSGGANSGGFNSGGANSGGINSGGAPSSGGANSGGFNSGGAPSSGGANSGGFNSGGAANSGGANSGGSTKK